MSAESEAQDALDELIRMGRLVDTLAARGTVKGYGDSRLNQIIATWEQAKQQYKEHPSVVVREAYTTLAKKIMLLLGTPRSSLYPEESK